MFQTTKGMSDENSYDGATVLSNRMTLPDRPAARHLRLPQSGNKNPAELVWPAGFVVLSLCCRCLPAKVSARS
jgi:hypothetical protein